MSGQMGRVPFAGECDTMRPNEWVCEMGAVCVICNDEILFICSLAEHTRIQHSTHDAAILSRFGFDRWNRAENDEEDQQKTKMKKMTLIIRFFCAENSL